MRFYNPIIAFVYIATALAAGIMNANAQVSSLTGTVLEARVPVFVIQNGTLLDGLAQLSKQSTGLSFTFEQILKTRFSDSLAPEVRFDLSLEKETIKTILNKLCKMDARYTWESDDSTINVYPQAIINDSSYVMNRRLNPLELKNITDADQAVFAIVAQIPPPFEQIALAQAGGNTSYSTPWNETLVNITVRHAFNLVARHMAPTGGWILNGSREFRTIGFHTREIHYSSQSTY